MSKKPQEWRFAATSRDGKTVGGTIRAATEKEASEHLSAQELIPISVEPIKEAPLARFAPRMNPRALTVFTRQFAVLVDAGLPLLTAVEMLADLTDDKVLRSTLSRVAKAVNGGSSLSDALRAHPKVFTNIYVHMVEGGETGGLLPESLTRVADYLEEAQALHDRLIGAVIYPAVVLSAASLAVIVVLTFVVPVFSELFAAEGLTLPFATRVLVATSDLILGHWPILLPGGVVAIWATFLALRSPLGRRWADVVLLHIPLVGDLVRKASVARVTRAMASMIHSGVMLSETLLAGARVAGNTAVEAAIMEAREAIHQGSDLSTPLISARVLPEILGQMVKVGEESGRLDEMLDKVADFFEMEVNSAVDGAMKALEPTLIIVLGAVLGGIIVAMYAPIFDLMTSMG